MKPRTLCTWIVAGAATVLVIRTPLAGQETQAKPDVLTALLTEVRGLRAAMEQMASAGPRVQLAMGRLQLQEQRTNTLLRRLDDLRARRAEEQAGFTRRQEGLAHMEEAAQNAPDPTMRAAAAESIRDLKAAVSRSIADLQRLGADEAELAGLVAIEQGRWNDINQRLDELERG